jgi:hypothetical protein
MEHHLENNRLRLYNHVLLRFSTFCISLYLYANVATNVADICPKWQFPLIMGCTLLKTERSNLVIERGIDHTDGTLHHEAPLYATIRERFCGGRTDLRSKMDAAIARGMHPVAAQVATDYELFYFIGVREGLIVKPQ